MQRAVGKLEANCGKQLAKLQLVKGKINFKLQKQEIWLEVLGI